MAKFAKGRSAIKMEESDDDDDVRFTAVKIENDSDLLTAPFRNVIEYCLPDRTPVYVRTLLKKLQQEGIKEPRHLNLLYPEVIMILLGARQQFILGEVSDVVEIRNAIARGNSNRQYHSKKGFGKGFGRTNYYQRSDRSRSRSRRGSRWHNGKGFDGYRKSKGKPKGKGDSHCLLPELNDSGAPPALWRAVEEGKLDVCQRLLDDPSVEVDESHKSWTPLMKVRINSTRNTIPGCRIHKILNTRSL